MHHSIFDDEAVEIDSQRDDEFCEEGGAADDDGAIMNLDISQEDIEYLETLD